jgi:hypothetical protein
VDGHSGANREKERKRNKQKKEKAKRQGAQFIDTQ